MEFLPEPNAAAGIARQIRASSRAYAVFSTAKLFLERPERHRVRISSADPAVLLSQIGDGPISFDRAAIERNAFPAVRDEFYAEETIQGEPIKGNFSNVARCRSTGTLLGPTNYHSYQPALRKLYEERFSRRMSFPEFTTQEIQIITGEQVVADWKEQARAATTYSTRKEAEPLTFPSLLEAEQHFRKTYLPHLVKSGQLLECSGPASRAESDRHVSAAVREAWERETMFPQQLVNHLRPYFVEAGLHFFKHRKRVLYVSVARPMRHAEGQVFSEGISAILKTLAETQRCKRPDLAKKILGSQDDSPEAASRKAQLAADLHYLVQAGHVIEFSDGALELPLDPAAKPPQQGTPKNAMPPASAPVGNDSAKLAETSSGEPVQPDSPALESNATELAAPSGELVEVAGHQLTSESILQNDPAAHEQEPNASPEGGVNLPDEPTSESDGPREATEDPNAPRATENEEAPIEQAPPPPQEGAPGNVDESSGDEHRGLESR